MCVAKKNIAVRASKGDYPLDEGKHLIVAVEWTAYADESGTHEGSEYVSVLGYVASPSQWKKFRKDWRGITQGNEFHGKEFFNPAAWRSSDSPYNGWTTRKAEKFIDRLVNTINRYRLCPVGFAYKTKDFLALDEEDRRYLTGAVRMNRAHLYQGKVETTSKLISTGAPSDLYLTGFHALLTEALKSSPRGAIVNYIFDRNKLREGLARQCFDWIKDSPSHPIYERMGLLSFGDSDKHEELQAADLYANVWNGILHGTYSDKELVERAGAGLARKSDTLSVGDANYFQAVLQNIEQERQEFFKQAESGGANSV